VSGQHPMNSALRRIAPLVAVLVVVGPVGVAQAEPGPDAAPPGATLAPDPVPQTTRHTPTKHVVARVAPRVIASVVAPPARPEASVKPTRPTRQAPVVKRKPRHDPPPAVVDVIPLRVDVHAGLGAIASKVRNDGKLALAAAALLAAVVAAASGAALAAATRRLA
jgi:hypothetical protein